MAKNLSFKTKGLLILAFTLTVGLLFGCGGPKRQTIIAAPMLTPSPSAEEILGGRAYKSAADAPPSPAVITPTGQALTLDQCLKIAEERSLSLDSADQNYLGAMWTRWQAVTDFLPKVDMKYQYTRLDEASKATFLSPGRGRNAHQWDTTVSQTVFAGFRNVASYRLANIGLESADIQRVQAREDLALLVKQAYYSILNMEKYLGVAEQTVKGFESHLNVARNFYDVGMVPKSDVLEAEVDLANAIQTRTVYEHNLKVARARLNTLVRQPINAPIKIVDALKYHKFPLSQEKCLQISMEERPEIKLAKKTVESQKENITVARSQFYPTINLQSTNRRAGETASLSGSRAIDRSEWNIVTVANLNLWEWGRTVGDVQKSKVNLNRSINEFNLLEDDVQLEVTKAYQELMAAEKNIGVSAKAIESAGENLRMIVERYQDQVSTSTDVLDAQTRYSQAQYNHYAALYDFNLAWATLERAIGRQIKP